MNILYSEKKEQSPYVMTILYKSPRNLQFLLEKFLHSDLGNVQCFSN